MLGWCKMEMISFVVGSAIGQIGCKGEEVLDSGFVFFRGGGM